MSWLPSYVRWNMSFVTEVNFNYTEANAWQYSLFVPQDVEGLISLYGGPKPFENQLEITFFVVGF